MKTGDVYTDRIDLCVSRNSASAYLHIFEIVAEDPVIPDDPDSPHYEDTGKLLHAGARLDFGGSTDGDVWVSIIDQGEGKWIAGGDHADELLATLDQPWLNRKIREAFEKLAKVTA